MPLHDHVSQVADRLSLSPPLPEKILESTRSELRRLKFQNPNGTFGKGDNDLRRASALLEYVAREQGGVKIPFNKLAKAACQKELDFAQFHRQVGIFRSPTVSTTTSTTDKSSIPSLAMKLGSHLTDSNGVALRAERLYLQITRFTSKNPHQIRDIARNRKTYEAVCFYLVATQNSFPKDQAGEGGNQLDVATVVDVSTDFTLSEFANILEHVQSIIEDMKEKASKDKVSVQQGQKAAALIKTKGGKRTRTSDDFSSRVAKGHSTKSVLNGEGKVIPVSTKRGRIAAAQAQDLLEEVKHRAEFLETVNDDSFVDEMPSQDKSSSRESSCYSATFLDWRRQVLTQATESATTILQKRGATGHDSSSDPSSAPVTREQALEYAAGSVLTSLGLLQARS